MPKVKNTIQVYDICSLSGHNHVNGDLIAEPFGTYLKVHPNLHLPHGHSFYHLVFFTKGSGFHTIDFERFDVRAGQIYFMIPGQVHSWNFDGEVDGYVVNFAAELFHSFLANDQYLEKFSFLRGVASESVVQLPDEAVVTAKRIFEQIALEVRNMDVAAPEMVRACLIELFITVFRHCQEDGTAQGQQQNQLTLNNFRKLLDRYYAEKRLPKEYAALLYITPNHLNALCNHLLGKPAGEVIRDRVLLEAKRVLINADQSISEIAQQLNFSDNSHFTKFFKKSTNSTPEEFRKASGGNDYPARDVKRKGRKEGAKNRIRT
jgi:AraC family transcriptional regulator, transcriptional activator of pobA